MQMHEGKHVLQMRIYMKHMMISILNVLFSLSYADDLKTPGVQGQVEQFPSCQDGLFVEYNSPLSGHKIKMCQVKKDGKLVKQGPYWEYDSKDQVVKKSFYQDGQLSTESTVQAAESPQSTRPAIQSSTTPSVQSSSYNWNYVAAGYGICALSPANKLLCQGYAHIPEQPSQGAIQRIEVPQIDFAGTGPENIIFVYNKKNIGVYFGSSHLTNMQTANVLSEAQLDVKISAGDEIKMISDGRLQICILTLHDLIQCWKKIREKQVGQNDRFILDPLPTTIPWPTQNGRPLKILAMNDITNLYFLCVLNDQGQVFCRDINLKQDEDPTWEKYQIKIPEKIIDMSAADNCYCFRVDAPKYYCFMSSPNYKTRVMTASPLLTVNVSNTVKDLEVGSWSQQCVLDEKGDVYCSTMSNNQIVYGPVKRDFVNPSRHIVMTKDLVCSEVADGKLHCLQVSRTTQTPEVKRELDFDFNL